MTCSEKRPSDTAKMVLAGSQNAQGLGGDLKQLLEECTLTDRQPMKNLHTHRAGNQMNLPAVPVHFPQATPCNCTGAFPMDLPDSRMTGLWSLCPLLYLPRGKQGGAVTGKSTWVNLSGVMDSPMKANSAFY